MTRRPMVAGNWKMNGDHAANRALVAGVVAGLDAVAGIDVVICPPSIYLQTVSGWCNERLLLGGQNVSEQLKPGAYTGEIHGAMLKDAGCAYVIVGHSERRALYGETDAIVAEKFKAARALGLIPILCVGETLAERESEQTESVLARQLGAVMQLNGIASFAGAVIAYEPVWAIGTGRTATPEQAQAAHAFLRALLTAEDAKISGSTPLLYGGSVKADNAESLFANPDVDGGLIGGASLKASEFLAICAAAQKYSNG